MNLDPKRPWELHYEVEQVNVVLETHALRILDAVFAPNQQVPWHRHSNVIDHFWIIEGQLRVETRSPDQTIELSSGGYCAVQPGCEHRVTGIGTEPCHFVNLQGFGVYDFIPINSAADDVT